jgi:hypothetical protein
MKSSESGLIISIVFLCIFILPLGFRTYIHLAGYDSVSNYLKGIKFKTGGSRHKKLRIQQHSR